MNFAPKIKPSILTYFIGKQVILRLGEKIATIEDERGYVRKIVEVMNGLKNISQIRDELCPQTVPADSFVDIINAMIGYGFIENANLYKITTLSEVEQKRYSRNIDFFGHYASFNKNKFSYQEILKKSKVVLLGCGGLGSHILFELAAVGIGEIKIVDFDRVELTNFNRQILFREKNIGVVKTEAARKNIQEFNSNTIIESVSKKISSEDDISSLSAGCDLVICVADKPRNEIVEWLNASCVKNKLPFINGGLDIHRSVFYSVIPHKTGCVQCWKTNLTKVNPLAALIIDLDKKDGKDFSAPAPAIAPLVAIAAGAMVAEALRILTKIQPPALTNKLMSFDFGSSKIKIAERWRRNKSCDCCGTE